MKTILTKEQSEKLIKYGVSADKASEIMESDDPVSEWTHKGCPLFTLADLLQLLPEEIKVNHKVHTLEISLDDGDWFCGYYFWEYDTETYRNYIESYTLPCYSEELIDALYELLIQCLDKRLCQI